MSKNRSKITNGDQKQMGRPPRPMYEAVEVDGTRLKNSKVEICNAMDAKGYEYIETIEHFGNMFELLFRKK